MKLFGSKDNDDGLNEGLEEDTFDPGFDTEADAALDMDADFGGEGSDDGGGPLAAPSRDFDGGKKSRKGLLAILLLLLAGGGAGGYYYLNMMGNDVPLNAAAGKKPAINAQTAAVIGDNVPPMPQAVANTGISQAVANTDIPQMDITADAGTDMPDPFAAVTTAEPIDMPGFDAPVAPVSDAATTTAAPTLEDVMDPFAEIGAAPAAEETLAAVPADDFQVVDAPLEIEAPAQTDTVQDTPTTAVADMPTDIPGDLPTGAPATVTDAAQEAAPANALPGFAEMAGRTAADPAGDLPMPDMTDVMAAPDAPDVAADTEGATTPAAAAGDIAAPTATPPVANAATKPAGTPPTDAEKAIVENAAMLDQLSAPAQGTAQDPAARGKTADEILGEAAIVRRLPDTYLVVRKDHASGDLDTRLKTARVALMGNRFSAAVQLFDELQRDYPRDERVTMGRALALQQMGRTTDALTAYEEILGANPKNLEALTNMLGLLKTTNPALAAEKLEELRTVYPYNADIAAQLGISHASLKNYDAAMQYLDMAEALEPGNAYVYYNKAVLYDRLGQQNMATSMYRRILQMHAEGRLSEPLPLEAIRNRLSSMR